MQVDIGVVNQNKLTSTATFVLSEAWPASSFVAKSLQHPIIYTYVEGMSLKTKSLLTTTVIGSTLTLGPSILQQFSQSQETNE